MKMKYALIGLLLCSISAGLQAKLLWIKNNTMSDIYVKTKKAFGIYTKWTKVKPLQKDQLKVYVGFEERFEVKNVDNSRSAEIKLFPDANQYGIYPKGNNSYKARGWRGAKEIGWTE